MVKVVIKQLALIVTIFIILTTQIFAFEYSIGQISNPVSKPYQGDTIELTTTITASQNNVCTITCTWKTNNYDGPIGSPEPLSKGESKNFGFEINVQGSNGIVNDKLIINCQRYSDCLFGSDESNVQVPVQFYFDYNGDGTCTTAKENCATAQNDCKCNSDKECRPNSERGADSYGCATYCGNKLIEKPYETCSNCPNDVGKCDGLQCFTGSECEGKFCVHNKCSHLAYVLGDSFCDKTEGENCKNSGSDCACGSNERCNPSGFCETYCGNNICEESERGKCKLDCTWCGDGTCQQSESCSSCSDDCGACKKATKEEELQRNIPKTSSVETESQKTSSGSTSQGFQLKNNKSILIVSGIVVVIIVIAILAYWLLKKKKRHKSKENFHCPKCHKKTDSQSKFCHHCGHKLK